MILASRERGRLAGMSAARPCTFAGSRAFLSYEPLSLDVLAFAICEARISCHPVPPTPLLAILVEASRVAVVTIDS
jgi:hypothetical protein